MHDFFEVLGIPDNARASDVRRACARRGRRWHPDFRGAIAPLDPHPSLVPTLASAASGSEVAVDFVDASAFVERLQADFFSTLD